MKEQHIECGDPLCCFFQTTFRSETLQFFVAVRSAATDGERCEQHSHVTFSHFFTLIYTHMRGSSRKFGVRTSCVMCHLDALMRLF